MSDANTRRLHVTERDHRDSFAFVVISLTCSLQVSKPSTPPSLPRSCTYNGRFLKCHLSISGEIDCHSMLPDPFSDPYKNRDLHHRRCAGEPGAGRVHVPKDGRTPGHGRSPFRGAKAGALLVLHDNRRGRGRQYRLCCRVGFLRSSIRPGALPSHSHPPHPPETTPRLCLYRVPYHGSIASQVCFYGEATPCKTSATNVWETVGIRGRAAKCMSTTAHPNSISTPSPPLSRKNPPLNFHNTILHSTKQYS